MSTPAGNIDADIQAAFSGAPQPSAPSADVDPDIYAAFQDTAAPAGATSGGVSGARHLANTLNIFARHPLTTGVGLAENALGGVTKSVGQFADVVTGSEPGTHDWAYQPHTQAGKEIATEGGVETAKAEHVIDVAAREDAKTFGLDPDAYSQTLRERGSQALGATGTVLGAAPVLGAVASRVGLRPNVPVASAPAGSQQSISAAAASPPLEAVSPELRGAVTRAQSQGAPVNAAALNRHIQAESLPVPVRLTEGQATQNPTVLSQEVNSRGTVPGLADRYNEQNAALTQNLQELRDRAGPDVFSTNPVEHGDTLIAAYKAKDAATQADISAKYQALKDANGGNFPVDGQAFVANADKALSANMKRPFLPSGVQATLNEFRDGSTPMTFENFENLRTTLAAEARKASRSGDGNAAAAVNLVREQLESLPLAGASTKVKALADTARSAAKARFDALRADPAYDAAVNDSVTPDRFVNRFVINGARDDVKTMRSNLADNPAALQTMSVATLDHLRNQALGTTGNFRQGGFNRALQGLDPKLGALVDPQTAEHLANLGEVARNVQAQPTGSFVNTSNTAVAAANMGKTIAEQAVNAKTLGLGGTLGRKYLEGRAARAAAKKSLAPGAGITP